MDKQQKPIVYWLLSGCFLIFLMVVVGGITRLTHSGLSMTQWNLLMGAIPPLNEQQWNEAFEQYKQFPEYQIVNTHFTLAEFKKIFFWEYLHRLIGRIIGIVFIVPFIYFWVKKKLTPAFVKKSLFLFFLGALQGFFGWYMVKSGLQDRPDVSHYRLALHLITAFITYSFTFWFALELMLPGINRPVKKLHRFAVIILLLLIIQIIYGAFVAGLDAGLIYNTFPKMNNQWIAANVLAFSPWWKNFIEHKDGVQFVHRYMAYAVTFSILGFYFMARRYSLTVLQKKAVNFLLAAVVLQFVLGVLTLLYRVPVALGALHQIGAFFLLTVVLFVLYIFRNNRIH
jgi:cytochrome c oxidase assembly protein subunit 15